MVWFKVDDRLHDHRKTRLVRKSDPEKRRDVAPFGLWALAGSWCGNNRTGGFIPLEVLQDWDDDAEELAERLVGAGLWWHDEVAGEPGYRFHDWADQNPSDGEDPGDYGRRGNHIRWHEKRGVIDPECDLCSPDNRGDVGGDDRGDSGGESSRPEPDPTRPDPTRPPKTPALRETDLDTNPHFVAFWKAYPKREDKGHARKAWLKMLKKNVPVEEVIQGAERYALKVHGADPKFTAMPATWLNGERWADEPPATPSRTHPLASEVEEPPDGLTDEEYHAWYIAQAQRRSS